MHDESCMKKILLVALEQLITDGSAGQTVMCGLVEELLKKGWHVDYFGLVDSVKSQYQRGDQFNPKNSLNLKKHVIRYQDSFKDSSMTTRFFSWIGSKNNQILLDPLPSSEVLYDAVIAFEGLPLSVTLQSLSRVRIAILGDPVGRRLWWSSGDKGLLRGFSRKFKAIILDSLEPFRIKRTIPIDWHIAMFGTHHVNVWSKKLSRTVIDLRPMMPSYSISSGDPPRKDRIIIAFGGTLTTTASQESLRPIFKDILPALRHGLKAFNFELRLIGDCPESIKKLSIKFPEVTLLGRVPSFERELAYAHFFLLPMNYPVGVRTRICSALAAGNICIIHSSTLINLPELRECQAVIVVDDILKYPAVIEGLMEESTLLNLRSIARKFALEHYAASVSASPLLNLIETSE